MFGETSFDPSWDHNANSIINLGSFKWDDELLPTPTKPRSRAPNNNPTHSHLQPQEDNFAAMISSHPSSTSSTINYNIDTKSEDAAFPVRLYFLLDVLQQDGLAHLACWQPHGRCFVVHNPDEFSQQILPLWFRQSRFGSFQRQLNLYGFRRLKSGRDKGGYYHEFFIRGQPTLASNIKRSSKKKSKSVDSDELEDPDFYSIPFVPMVYPVPMLAAVARHRFQQQAAPAPVYVAATPAISTTAAPVAAPEDADRQAYQHYFHSSSSEHQHYEQEESVSPAQTTDHIEHSLSYNNIKGLLDEGFANSDHNSSTSTSSYDQQLLVQGYSPPPLQMNHATMARTWAEAEYTELQGQHDHHEGDHAATAATATSAGTTTI